MAEPWGTTRPGERVRGKVTGVADVVTNGGQLSARCKGLFSFWIMYREREREREREN